MKLSVLFLCLITLLFAFPILAQKKAASSGYVPVANYDPKRNAEQDVKDAVVEARRTGKRILLEVGGEWCGWCRLMDKYFEQNPKLLAYREQQYITVKINFSQENENKKLLSGYPQIPGYPHIFVLDSDGKLLHSEFTGDLEDGTTYNLEKFFAFLKEWAPASEGQH